MDVSERISGCEHPGGCTLDEFADRSERYRPITKEVFLFMII
jgi:hypothetical protein